MQKTEKIKKKKQEEFFFFFQVNETDLSHIQL